MNRRREPKPYLPTLKRSALLLLVLFGCVGCDQVTKGLARQSLAGTAPISLFHDTLRLQYAENPGSFLSLGADLPDSLRSLLFVVLIGVILVGILSLLVKSARTGLAVSLPLALVLAGGCGNLIDRIVNHGRVIDFLNLGIGPVRTGIFNVADIAITLGAFWLALLVFRPQRRPRAPG